MMLSVAFCVSFYLFQNIKRAQQKEPIISEPKNPLDQFYLDRFKIAVYILLQQRNQNDIDKSLNTIEQIKQEMREQKYNELGISMLYTNAAKQMLNIQ